MGNGPPVGPPPIAAVTLRILPIRPSRTMRDGEQEHAVVVAPLLRADLHDAVGLLGDLAELLPLVDRERERLLAVDVLAGLHGVDADLGVPVVGRADDDGVDVLAVEDLAVVLVDVGLALADVPVVLGPFGVACRRRRRPGNRRSCVRRERRPSLVRRADQAESRPVVLGPCLVGHGRPKARGTEKARGCSPRREGNRGGCGCGSSSFLFSEHSITLAAPRVPRAPGRRP